MDSYKYESGMFGGKFLPFHVGHAYCVEQALKLCKKVHLILFVGGESEEKAMFKETGVDKDFLSVESRVERIKHWISEHPEGNRIIFHVIDISKCRNEDGSENWTLETPLVIKECGKFYAVFGSEPSYADYFAKAYPWAVYEILDAKREQVPISATKIRNMTSEEAKKWIV